MDITYILLAVYLVLVAYSLISVFVPVRKPKIFVFGSNLNGNHWGGSAKEAHENWEAKWGVGVGPTGKAYAIPTLDIEMKPMPLELIERAVIDFILHALDNYKFEFIVVEIGCGIAGFTPEQIAPMFKYAPDNVKLPKSFKKIIKEMKL